MEYALDKDGKIVNASSVDYGIYFCTECKKPCGLRKPYEKVTHFFHFEIDPDCSLCYKDEKEFLNTMKNKHILQECNNSIEVLLKNATDENWFQAIDCLLEYNQLYRLSGCKFAIKPLCKYFKEKSTFFSYETWEDFERIDRIIVENTFSLIQSKDEITEENVHYIESLKNKHLSYLLELWKKIKENKSLSKFCFGLSNNFFYEVKKLKNILKIKEWQRLDKIDLLFIDYFTIYNYLTANKNILFDELEYFYKRITQNNDYLDLGYMKFMEYLRNIYYEEKRITRL